MPKIFDHPIKREIQDKLKAGESGKDMIRGLIEKYNADIVGQGRESIVALFDNREKEVVAFNYKGLSPLEAKRIFYLQRIFSTLFPHNFPHFYASFGKQAGNTRHDISGNLRQRIEPSEHKNFKFIEKDGRLIKVVGVKNKRVERLIKYPIGKVEQICSELGISFCPDANPNNYIIAPDGGEYYVDTILFKHYRDSNWNLNKIKDYMDIGNYSKRDKYIVMQSIDRLKTLEQESKLNY